MNDNNSNNVCEESVYNKIYTKNSKIIFNYIYYKCGDEEKANDVVQEAFIKLWQNCKKVPLKNAKAFLYKVANNNFLNVVKAEKIRLNYTEKKNDVTNENPEFLMEEQQYKEKLERAISNLTPAQRTAFLMNRIDGKKYKEIAEILNISVKAVEKRIHGALVSIRKEIDEI